MICSAKDLCILLAEDWVKDQGTEPKNAVVLLTAYFNAT
jgi:hypothetical protein